MERWFAPAEQIIHHAMPPNAVADWDSTVVPRYGKQEDAAIGYNPQKPGRPSHHPLACVIGGTRLCLHMEWRKGNTVSASGWVEAMEKVWRSPLAQHRIRLNRGDIGFGQEPIMAWHEQGNGKRPSFLLNSSSPPTSKRPSPRSHGTIGRANPTKDSCGWSNSN